jgi:hypothetical protein
VDLTIDLSPWLEKEFGCSWIWKSCGTSKYGGTRAVLEEEESDEDAAGLVNESIRERGDASGRRDTENMEGVLEQPKYEGHGNQESAGPGFIIEKKLRADNHQLVTLSYFLQVL